MRKFILFSISVVSAFHMEGQSKIEQDCLINIREASKKITFPNFEKIVVVLKDTAHFGKSIILLTDTKPEFYKIFTMGLLFPKLILGASTSGDGKFKIDPSSAEDTLSISSLEELKLLNNSLKIRAFSFLLWQKGLANPKLFIFELTNENINIETEQFIRKAKLSSFGFCSILI